MWCYLKNMNIKSYIKETNLCEEIIFKMIFDAYFKVLRNFLIYRFRNNQFADDIAQNAFVKLWENCKILKKEQAKSFLFTTAIRLSLNEIKHQKIVSDFEINFASNSYNTESPHFILEESEFKQRLEKAINNLPDKQREVFLMNRFENQSYKEIATLLNLSVKAVEKRMHQALLSIREITGTV